MKKRKFTDLLIWQKSHKVALQVYRLSAKFPKSEVFGMTSQIRRAAYSIPANIAEGCALSQKLFIRHLYIAQGSLEEVKYFLILSYDVGYITRKEKDKLHEDCVEVSKMLTSFISKTEKFE